MRSSLFLAGRMRHHDTPDWKSLEELLGSDELCAHFMWMHDVLLEDGTVLHAYKHRWTRCYFHLADDGRVFYYVTDDLYHEVEPYTAIKAVFAESARHLDVCVREVMAPADVDPICRSDGTAFWLLRLLIGRHPRDRRPGRR